MPAAPSSQREFFGHPIGVYVCFFTEMWERFSFYGMKALLFLYLTKYHLFGDSLSYDLIGAYGGLVYAMPVIGGLLADRFLGMRKAVIFGGILLVLGHLGMAFEGSQATQIGGTVQRDNVTLQVFYFSLALIIMGVGFLKPNISTIVGRLYSDNDSRRESGFTLFYAGINLGALFSSLICGYLGETFGWKYGFGAAGLGMILGLAVFIANQRFLMGHAESSNPEALRAKALGFLSTEHVIYLGTLLGTGLIWQLIQRPTSVQGAMHVVSVVLLAWFVWFIVKRCTRIQREQMMSLMLLIGACLLYFSLYEQTYGSWLAFTDRLMIKEVWDIPISASQSTSLGALFLVALTPAFAWLWPWLEKRGLNPTKPAKTVLGLALGGLAFVPLAIAAQGINDSAPLASIWWLIAAYFILELGEMCLSPIGLAAVSELAVKEVVSLMMGTWFLATAYSEVIAAQFSKLTSLDGLEHVSIIQMASKYGDSFVLMIWLGMGAAAVYFALAPVMHRWMHEPQ